MSSRGYGTLPVVNHPVTPPAKRHPTPAAIRRAEKAATRPDGSVSALGFMAELMDPEGRYQPTPDMVARTKRAKR